MKKLILLTLVCCACTLAKAQYYNDDNTGGYKPAFSIGPELAFPSRSGFKIGYGASAKAEIPVINKFSLSVTGGFSEFRYKSGIVNIEGSQHPADFIPLKAGARYKAGPGLFLEGELGDVIETRNNFGNIHRNLFAFSLGPAFLIKISPKQNVDVGIRYEQWSKGTLQQTALRIAYRIGG